MDKKQSHQVLLELHYPHVDRIAKYYWLLAMDELSILTEDKINDKIHADLVMLAYMEKYRLRAEKLLRKLSAVRSAQGGIGHTYYLRRNTILIKLWDIQKTAGCLACDPCR